MEYKKLGDYCEVKGGKRLPKGDQLVEYETNHPYLRISDYSNGSVNLNNLKYVTEETFQKISRYIINEGDIFLSIVGTIGIVDFIDYKLDSASLTENAVRIRSFNESVLSTKFLSYFLKSDQGQNEMFIRTVGSTQPKLAITRIKDINIPIIDIKSQQKISNILSTIDEKITLNKNLIANLEELSQTLFKRWFVDFEFPDENGNPYKSSGGEMIDSEMGLIPRGWEVKSADEIYEIAIGKTPPRKLTELFSEKEGIDWVSISDMKSEGMFIKSTKEKIIEEGVVDYKVKIVPKDSVLLSFKLTIGRVKLTNKELTTNEAIAHFYSSNINKLYTYLYLKNFEYGYLGNTSSIATAVNSKIIKKMPILVPEQKVLKRFINIAEPFMNRINIIQNENIELNQLRDTLLPKLMSGEIEIPDDIEVNEDELSI
ncbi:restriction endonuclease subunit S [Staphylococcus pseudintermedius]|uniref:restriction endonuclease subunit S n=1 Tax=Staphylococcus pseudintermedius TaxID=283734 RepID=UPI000C1C7724|nr:restriction endonuclease subunit S [Staphylococcus pseudintermedius]EGQ2922525.1 restriction endonuclease subunit S [Staphylococcus pseudintermedius]EGQ3206409.1 restriction endonuclease subunit S [Staphylococcus pseudintermedius]EGQ3208074.1 restriction endonuclease subunit S [Staphylococcus pseudintermedius]EGQ3568440.1 restriction endonuclease subunit S [Staphylococcus pseudintermedius]EGQ3650434.1 restriction endonuclease subunit S [Staphylococcus pseudintermedius]